MRERTEHIMKDQAPGPGAMVTGLAWYRREQWARLREISEDVGELEDTYDEWLASATRVLRELRRSGAGVRKVDVDVEDLLGWCNERGRPVNGASRANYVAEKMRRKAVKRGERHP
ncbi:MAG: hypothetical protein HZC42_12960 [Candidatus Eisenbacteria bacterium]|nr:hypothetical protein [Candidatus Eisenbacteria bacterium]